MAFSMIKEHKNSLRRCLSSDGIIPKKPLTSRAGKILHQEIQAMMAFQSRNKYDQPALKQNSSSSTQRKYKQKQPHKDVSSLLNNHCSHLMSLNKSAIRLMESQKTPSSLCKVPFVTPDQEGSNSTIGHLSKEQLPKVSQYSTQNQIHDIPKY